MMRMDPETVLVTGAAGFIGSHLTEDLLEGGVEVHAVDCLTDYYDPVIKQSNLSRFEDHPGCHVHRTNILNLDFSTLLPKLDAVFHMAAQAGVRASWGSEFNEYVEQNIRATQRLLEAMKNHTPNVPMVLASSSSVYGVPDQLPMHETMRPEPYSPYGVTKLAAENLGMLYNQNFDLPVVVHRFFTVYGPRQRPDMAFSRFLTWVYRNAEITVYGDGKQTRDFSYVKDVTRAVIESLNQEVFGEVYNIGGGNRVSVNETLEMIEEVSDREVRSRNEPMPEGDVPHTDADTSKIREDLGWEPEHTLREGLSRQWEWIRENPDVRKTIPDPGS
jgi:UDP-glucose 4-epimerase